MTIKSNMDLKDYPDQIVVDFVAGAIEEAKRASILARHGIQKKDKKRDGSPRPSGEKCKKGENE